ncbi:coiled-coil and C2 domain-containing protein 2A-like isoform X2 [Lytechinus variegatus]|uniref:coiled-coil and C2 domain-containing protein 2A-like isoform X1 n=1 Tax=Lytechinus variegatus TaxID=7654 RepID=UPI001BB1F5F2|nr:coiled-coil and C2 domain-containing protein 2A-like isoform X1 [Lytechinus variegatus]XP_041483935.1 coiled-coil and C2 domain-containing protein 2A-like isoform X1 [Lytechinus variegatus]XP_041483936.1 coiled-coil and C2 domain-containing protein 2A-like isoform X2 [Lytechinus variegatus]
MSQTFREKIRQRRRDLRENTMDSTQLADTSATPGRGSRHEDISADDGGVDDVEEMPADPIEEIHQAESLMEKLTQDRESKKKELFESLEPADEEQEKKKETKPKRRTEIPTIQETGEEEEPDEDTKPKKKKKGKKPDMAAAVLAAKAGVETGKVPSTMNATIRERIRKKMAEAKEKAEESMKDEVAKDPDKDLPARRLRGLRARDMATRFDEPSLLTKEEIEEDKMLNESIIAKEKWRESFKKVKAKQAALPTEEEAFDFFTRSYDPEPESREIVSEPTSDDQPGPSTSRGTGKKGKSKDDDDEEEGGKESTPLLSEVFVDRDMWKLQPTQLVPAEYVPLGVREKKEEGYFFVPSIKTVPSDQKVPENTQPRYLEDEGFYVGVRPDVSQRNQNIMEHRLLQRSDKGKGWFGEDGRIIALPDPVKDTPTRPRVVANEEREPELQTVFRKAMIADTTNQGLDFDSGLGDRQYQIDIDINTLVFTHHPYFSKEHVLESKLRQLYDQYLRRKQKDMAQYLTDKLQALKSAVASLKEQLNSVNMQETIQLDTMQKVKDYKVEIRQTRRLRDYELQHDRQLMKQILKTWRDIKKLREKDNCINTAVKLSVRKEEANASEDEAIWKREIEDEIDEQREDHDDDYQLQIDRYRATLQEWKQENKAKKKSKKKKKKSGSQENLTETGQNEEDEEEEKPKPIKPSFKFDEDESRDRIKEKMTQIRRKPGETILHLEVSNTAVITPTQDCSRQEQQRRNDMQRYRCFIKVLINDKEVSRTTTKSLTSDFTIHFGNIFNVEIVHWPESISIQLFETGILSNNHLANVFLNAPNTQMTSDKVHVDQFEFSSDQKVDFDHSAVGSGITFSIGDGDEAQDYNLLTSGSVYASVAWGLADDGLPLIPPAISTNTNALSSMKEVDALAAIGATGIIDNKKLAKWLMEARLDPNDPANSFLLQMIKNDRNKIESKEYFRLEQLQQEFDFVTDEELETNRRFRLLQLREKEVEDFRNYKMVPAIEKEIAENFFEAYELKLEQEEQGLIDEDMDARRAQVAKFIAQIRKRVIQRYRAAQHRYTLQDIVNESLVPDVSLLGDTLVKLVEPRRPLKPQRKERKTVTAQNLTAQSVNILINIERAFEIPTRKPDPKLPGQNAEVRPFVEVVFQQTTKQTCVAEGANPNWNEELALPFKAPNNDYSASNLQTVRDVIYMNLFDEVVIDLLQDDRDRTTNIHQRLEKRWLGSLSIPFSTVYFQGKVAGAIRVEAPSSLLGYERTRESAGRGAANATYLSVFITVEPPLAPPELFREKFETLEDDQLLNQAELLQAQVSSKFPKRQITSSVIDMNGNSVFVCRYFKSLAPPPVLMEGDNQVEICERIARYVSLIPSISDSVLFPGVCNIWSTCQQFLQMMQGDEEEHAVLLVNYFLHLGKKAWLILGTAIPEGPTAYALSEEGDGQYWIWNPSTGEHYKSTDSFCPLKSVECLINEDNLWANIQIQEETSRLNFDVKKSMAWKPLFNSSFPRPALSSMQEESLEYEQTILDDVVDLQNKIEKKLRSCIMEWRPRHITRWNRHVIHTFRDILKKLEYTPNLLDNENPNLKSILESYNLCGFPLHMSYTDIKSIVDKVRSTGVHKNESNDVEYALAVHIHPYPNHILSVWIYLASVTRRR